MIYTKGERFLFNSQTVMCLVEITKSADKSYGKVIKCSYSYEPGVGTEVRGWDLLAPSWEKLPPHTVDLSGIYKL